MAEAGEVMIYLSGAELGGRTDLYTLNGMVTLTCEVKVPRML